MTSWEQLEAQATVLAPFYLPKKQATPL